MERFKKRPPGGEFRAAVYRLGRVSVYKLPNMHSASALGKKNPIEPTSISFHIRSSQRKVWGNGDMVFGDILGEKKSLIIILCFFVCVNNISKKKTAQSGEIGGQRCPFWTILYDTCALCGAFCGNALRQRVLPKVQRAVVVVWVL